MFDDTTDRAREIGRWLDAPMDLDEFYGRPSYRRCALVLAAWLFIWILPADACTRTCLRGGSV